MTDVGIITVDNDRRAVLQREEGREGELLRKFLAKDLAGKGIPYSRAALQGGTDHASVYNVLHGKNDSIKVMFQVLDVLGYDVVLRRRDV